VLPLIVRCVERLRTLPKCIVWVLSLIVRCVERLRTLPNMYCLGVVVDCPLEDKITILSNA
jgi:hypothetical protein